MVSRADVFGAFWAINRLFDMGDGVSETFRKALHLLSMLSHFFFFAEKKRHTIVRLFFDF